MKRTSFGALTLFLIAAMALIACGGASAGSDPVNPDDPGDPGNTTGSFTYTLDGANATITGLTTNSLGATSIDIPATIDGHPVTAIGASAFQDRTALQSAVIPVGVTALGASAFKGCSALTSVTLPEGLASIGDNAFTGCVELTTVNIPATVTSITLSDWATSPFYGCTKLAGLTITTGHPTYVAESGILYTSDRTTIVYVAPGKMGNVTIPDSVIYINGRAFMDRAQVTGLTFGSSPKLAQILISAFEGSGLKTLTLPNTVTYLGSYAFRSCPELTSFSTGNGLTQIGSQVFYGCEKLVTFTLGSAVSYFNRNAFDRCGDLSGFVVASENTTYTAVGGVLYNAAKTTLERFPASLNPNVHAYPDTLTTLAAKAFADFRGNTLEIPAKVTTIGDSCFWQTYLYTWTWKSTASDTSLGLYAFQSNTGLVSCTFDMTTPPKTAASGQMFTGTIAEFRIKVPSASVNTYKNTTNWSNYANIIISK